jgi:hypothetical protein
MTPEEELRGLSKLIRQYETVYHTTSDPEQRVRVQRQLKDLQSYREKFLKVHVINEAKLVEEDEEKTDPLENAPLLRGLVASNSTAPRSEAVLPFSPGDSEPTRIQLEMFYLALYMRYYEKEYLPFLTEKHLKLDFGLSFDRDRFYNTFQALQRKIAAYRDENKRLLEGMVGRDMELEVRKRNSMLTRLIQAEAARFFRAIARFCGVLIEDAHGDMVKCLNCGGVISFDPIEGTRVLRGRTVGGALSDLQAFAAEAVAFLNIPEIEGQETERANRH